MIPSFQVMKHNWWSWKCVHCFCRMEKPFLPSQTSLCIKVGRKLLLCPLSSDGFPESLFRMHLLPYYANKCLPPLTMLCRVWQCSNTTQRFPLCWLAPWWPSLLWMLMPRPLVMAAVVKQAGGKTHNRQEEDKPSIIWWPSRDCAECMRVWWRCISAISYTHWLTILWDIILLPHLITENISELFFYSVCLQDLCCLLSDQ